MFGTVKNLTLIEENIIAKDIGMERKNKYWIDDSKFRMEVYSTYFS